jgi:dipeptidyl aminopeptidase/acylaminoacyl peptidase
MPVLGLFTAVLFAVSGEHIAFLMTDESGREIVHVAELSGGTHRPIGHGDSNGAPVWSPDGTALAYTTTHDGEDVIAVWTVADGKTALLGAARPASERLAWSPEGSRIAFEDGEDDAWRIGVVHVVDGTVTHWGGGAEGLLAPAWLRGEELARRILPEAVADLGPALARAGELLMAVAAERGPAELATRLVLLTPNEVIEVNDGVLPSGMPRDEWSPNFGIDEEGVTFESGSGGNREIFAFTPRTGTVCLSNHRLADWNPRWAPTGRWVLFESFRDGRRALYRSRPPQGSAVPVAVHAEASCWDGAWSPDARRVAYVSDDGGVPGIWIVRIDGGDPVRLTPANYEQRAPAWQR